MSVWQQRTTDVLYVLVEAIAWAMVIRLMATLFEHEFLRNVASEIDLMLASGQFQDQATATQVGAQVADAVRGAVAGPSVILVVLAGLGGFYVTRGMVQARITGSLGALIALIASIFGLNLLLHIVLAGDIRIWDSSGLAAFIGDPGARFAGSFDVVEFVRSPDINRPHGTALALSFAGMIAVWGRFMIAGRKAVSFDRVLRSFTLGFIAVLFAVVGSRMEGASGIATLGVPYFVLAILLLAVANAARGAMQTGDMTKRAPWVTSVLLTVGALAALAMLVGLLAYAELDRPLLYAIDRIGDLVGVLIIIIITPISWLVIGLLSWILPDGLADNLEQIGQGFGFQPGEAEELDDREGGGGIPGWIPDALRMLAFSLIMYLAYRVIRAVLNRGGGDPEDEYEEARSSSTGGAGLGSLLRNLFPRGGKAATTANWMRRHRVYRLYGRTVVDAEERGLPRRPGETPLEFSAVAGRVLDAPFFNEIAAEFDRARYGRHYPDDEWTLPMEQALVRWEEEHPVTEELRRSVAGAQPLSDADEFALRIAAGRERARAMSGGAASTRKEPPTGF